MGRHAQLLQSQNWGYTTDPNQTLKIKEQLESGVREIVFDVHWYFKKMLLYHGDNNYWGCDPGKDRTFREDLDHIKDWFDDGNRDEVVILKVELVIENRFSKFENQLEDKVGEYLFRPDSDGIDLDPENGLGEGCMGFPINLVTKEDVLAAGKKPHRHPDESGQNCTADGGLDGAMYSGIWRGWEDLSYVSGTGNPEDYQDKFEKPSSPEECGGYSEQERDSNMLRVFDSKTMRGWGGTNTAKIHRDNIEDYFACGLNIFEMYDFNSADPTTLNAEDLVWGWGENESIYGTSENFAPSSLPSVSRTSVVLVSTPTLVGTRPVIGR